MPSTYSGRTISPAQAASYASAAGFSAALVPIMVAIAIAESSLDPGATHTNSNGSTDYGLWQINGAANADVMRLGSWNDPAANARMAKAIYDRQGLTAWSVYKSGAYKANLSATAGLVGGPIFVPGLNPSGTAATGEAIQNVPDMFGLPWFLNQDMISRVLWGFLGVLLIVVGMVIVFRRQVGSGIKLATNLTPAGRVATVAGTTIKGMS